MPLVLITLVQSFNSLYLNYFNEHPTCPLNSSLFSSINSPCFLPSNSHCLLEFFLIMKWIKKTSLYMMPAKFKTHLLHVRLLNQ